MHNYRGQKNVHRFLSLLIFSAICFVGAAKGISVSAHSSENAPGGGTPRELQEAWLRFHETDLCQEVDAVFIFHRNGMEAWSRIESDKTQLRFQELFNALRDSFRIELYTTRPPSKKKSENEEDPPPSIWQNLELRANLGDPAAQFKGRLDPEERIQVYEMPSGLMKQRLLIYAERTLDGSRKMERYADDLPALVRLSLDPAATPELKSKSIQVCAAHVQSLEKQIVKLTSNLTLAFPKSSKGDRQSSPQAVSAITGKTLADKAEQVSANTHNVAQRIERFIHPETYTIGLDELRNPSLLESLRGLKEMVVEFQKSVSKPPQSSVK